MEERLLEDLKSVLAEFGFRQVEDFSAVCDAVMLLKRQTLNMNRAVVVVQATEMPADFRSYLKRLRRLVAFKCGFFPFFWGIGIQVVVFAKGACESGIDPAAYVAKIDNQWSIVQSLFLVDTESESFSVGRSWGQTVSSGFQEEIFRTLARNYNAVTASPQG